MSVYDDYDEDAPDMEAVTPEYYEDDSSEGVERSFEFMLDRRPTAGDFKYENPRRVDDPKHPARKVKRGLFYGDKKEPEPSLYEKANKGWKSSWTDFGSF